MSATIFVESNELRTAVGRMDATIRSMGEIQQAISQIDSRVANSWRGRAATQNAINFRTLDSMTTNYLLDARGTKSALDQAADSYDRTEQSQVTKVEQLSTKGIF